MCGLAGIFGQLYTREAISHAHKLLVHRGPDGGRILEFKNGAVAHTRLAIIDPRPTSDQPMTSPDGRYTIVFNGEIYNHLELKPALESNGWNFRTKSDTEVLLAGLVMSGPTFLTKLRGMFAFALHDSLSGEVLIARDRLGIKPLYYTCDQQGFAFASDQNTLLRTFPQRFKLTWENLALGVPFGGCPRPLTVWQNLNALEAGHWAIWKPSDSRITSQQWWDLPTETDSAPKENLEELIADSIRDHLIADVPVDLMLSGGFDSTILASYLGGTGVRTYTIDDPTDPGEVERAQQVASAFGLTHELIPHTILNPYKDLLETVSINGEPMPYLDPQMMMAKALRARGGKVVLSGLGPDELLAGYRFHKYIDLPWRLMWWGLKTPSFVPAKVSRLLGIKDPQNFYENIHFRSMIAASSIYHQDVITGLSQRGDVIHDLFPRKFKDPLKAIAYYDVKIGFGTHHLHTADQFFMAYGIEGRFPYLDHRIVEWSFNQPASVKRKDGMGKMPMRKLAEKRLPSSIAKAAKKGFIYPETAISDSVGELRAMIEKLPKDKIRAEVIAHTLKSLDNKSQPDPTAMYVMQTAVWMDMNRRAHLPV